MYHEKSKLCEICLDLCSSEAYMARENKVDTCIDLVLQESNSKTKLEVWDAFRTLPMRDNGEWEQKKAEKKLPGCEAQLPCDRGKGKKIVWESQPAQQEAPVQKLPQEGSCAGKKCPGPKKHVHVGGAPWDPKGDAARGCQLTTLLEADSLLKEVWVTHLHGFHNKWLCKRVSRWLNWYWNQYFVDPQLGSDTRGFVLLLQNLF